MQDEYSFTEQRLGGLRPMEVARSNKAPVRAPADSVPPSLLRYDLTEMEVRWDADLQTLWSFMTPSEEPKYTRALLRDMRRWQLETQNLYRSGTLDMRYVVLGCRHPSAFNLGGDLALVSGAIEQGDKAGLEDYGNACVDILHENMLGLGLPVITIALLQGDTVGGGFESALSFNVLIAERHVQFSLPENAFGMFPGVGAHSLLTRKLNAAQAERLMMSGRTYSAQEMYDLGLVHVLADTGKGEEAARAYIQQNMRRFNGQLGVYRAAREVNPVLLGELRKIVRIWAETGMQLTPQQVKIMKRMSGKQGRVAAA
ncbi:MAG TPA: crotonase/enoyl-CoA hydratase family protein [Sphingobium sp.]